MAENTGRGDDRSKNDDPERRAAPTGGAPAVADDGDVAFGGMVGIAIVSAVIISMLALGGFFTYEAPGSSAAPVVEEVEAEEPAEEPEEEPEAAPATEPATATIVASDDGIILTGTVPDQATADSLVAAASENYEDDQIDNQLEILEGAEPFDLNVSGELSDPDRFAALGGALGGIGSSAGAFTDELALAEAPEPQGAAATVAASQSGIVLTGTVPDQATADELAAGAASLYAEDQIDNQLVVDDGADPYTLTVTGSMTDAVLYNGVQSTFTGLGDNAGTFTDELALAESGDVEAALNALDQILFQSGTDVILDESLIVVDEAAELMNANPDLAFEVGGHTDSRGDDTSNQSLSELRANAVTQALRDRDVTNDLTPRGYGETRLKENPDDTAEQQQINRRIEFRII